jgi:predicted ferric reductase
VANGLWIATRALGITAYLLLSIAMLVGLSLSTRTTPRSKLVSPLALHRALSLLAILTTLGHAGLLLFDKKVAFGLGELLIPLRSSYRPFAVGLGTVALYLLLLLELSQHARKWLGQAAWRTMHALTFVLYLAATFHGISAGTDSARPALWLLYLGSATLISGMLFLRLFRLVVPLRTGG